MTQCHYRYEECGLDNVLLVDLPGCTDDAGADVITIPNINQLHRLLAYELATKATELTPRELRFLRSELGHTQAQLAAIVGKDAQTVGRWERGDTTPIDGAAETVIRILVLQHVGEGVGASPSVEDLARRSVAGAGTPPIWIDASNPAKYRAMPMREAA